MSTSAALGSLLSSSQSSTSSAINISSLLQAMDGASTPGIDVTSAVAAAVYAAQAPERVWQAEQTTLTSQSTDLNSLSTAVTNLENDLYALNDPMGSITSLSLSSSQSSLVSGTAGPGAVAGTHTITVSNVAQAGSWYSAPVATSSTILPVGSFDIVEGVTPTAIPIGSGVNTLDQLATYINNSQNLNVTASVINDSTGARLSIVSNNTGAANNFSIPTLNADGSSPVLGFKLAQTGKDASLMVDGTPITSASNTVVGALNGVTLNLAGASTTPVSVVIAPDVSDAGTAIQSFVTDYNSIVSTLNTQFTYNLTTGASGDLSGDSAVRALQSQLLTAMSYVSPGGGTDSSLGSMGISMGNDGTLTIDSSTLNNALTNNFSAVQNFFQGSSLDNFAAQLSTQLNSYTDLSDGAFTVDLQSISSESTDLTNQINDFQTNYITPLQTTLQSEYSQAEIALQSMPTQEQELNSELGNNNSSNNG
jgi:flagellar hook-associated protein 2